MDARLVWTHDTLRQHLQKQREEERVLALLRLTHTWDSQQPGLCHPSCPCPAWRGLGGSHGGHRSSRPAPPGSSSAPPSGGAAGTYSPQCLSLETALCLPGSDCLSLLPKKTKREKGLGHSSPRAWPRERGLHQQTHRLDWGLRPKDKFSSSTCKPDCDSQQQAPLFLLAPFLPVFWWGHQKNQHMI